MSCAVRALSDAPITGAMWATVISFFCLLGYFLTARSDTNKQYTSDNVYYLGLLFTLLSLVYSLVTLFILDGGETDKVGQTHNLIGSFGIALISTIFGILFRIVLLQPSTGSVDELRQLSQERGEDIPLFGDEQSVHHDLADAAFKLRRELTQAIADMGVFRQAIIQAANETVLESDRARATILQQVEEAGHEQTRILSTLSDTAVGKLNSSVEHIQNSLAEMANQQMKSVQHSVELTAQITEKMESSIHGSLGKIANGGKKIEIVLSSVHESLQNNVSDLQRTIRNMEETIQEQARMLSKITDTVFGNLNTSGEHIQESLDELVKQQLQRAQRSVELTAQSTEKLERSIQDLLTRIAAGGEKIEAAFGSAPESLQSIVSSLQSTTKSVESLAAKFAPLQSNLQNTMTLLVEVIHEIEKTSVTLNDTTGEFCQTLRQEAGQWQSMTQKVRSTLIEAVEKFTQVVRNS